MIDKNYPITITGRVIKGSGDGKKMGIPTANIEFKHNLKTITQGVYSTRIKIDKKKYFGISHYGPRYVFNETTPQLEIHILDFDQDIYGKIVEIELLGFIRPTMKFKNTEEMLKQIDKDIAEVKRG